MRTKLDWDQYETTILLKGSDTHTHTHIYVYIYTGVSKPLSQTFPGVFPTPTYDSVMLQLY
jgi:hypothetical protein